MKFSTASLVRMFEKGLVMEQHKDPALSQGITSLMFERGERVIWDYEPPRSLDGLDSDEVIRLARLGRIVDERDGMHLFKKLRACHGRQVTILVDAIDDEPYISSQLGPLLHLREECVSGAALAKRAVGGSGIKILVYKNIADLDVKIPKSIEGIKVERVGGTYPAENRRESSFIQEGGVNYLYLGACALIHLHRAVFRGWMQTTGFVTVAGNCVDRPRNLEVSLGATASQVFDACGLIYQPTRVVVGGSMTGVTIQDTDETKVTPVTRALLAFREDVSGRGHDCIGCGRCSQVCSLGLNPMLIYKCVSLGRTKELETTDYQHCTGCMACSYRCPAKLDLSSMIYRLGAGPGNRREDWQ